MKISKSRIAVLVLLAVTMIYSVAFCWSFQTYNAWRQERIKQIPEEMKPWIDIVPFWGTSTAQTFGIGVYVLILSWIALLLVGDKLDKNKVIVVAIIGLTLVIGIPRVQATNKIYIDVLVAHDEEVTNEWILDIVLDDPDYINTKWVYNQWFDVVLVFHKYVLWDSDDSCNDLLYLLDEAIAEVGWYWGDVYEDETMELMMVFTGQNDPEMNGYSPLWNRAMICEMGDLSFTIMHELGHQFGCGHCDDLWCYMNPDTPFAVGGYCSYHQGVIMANRELLLKPLLSVVHGYGYGAVDLSPTWEYHLVPISDMNCYYYNYGEVVTATATASSYFGFDCWWLDGVKTWSNPLTFTMDSDHALIAEFYYIPGPGGGGGTCPTLFVWNGTAYVEEGLLDIHAYSDVTVQHTIQNALALENGFYNLQLRELDNHTSHIDQVKLYAVDDEGEWHLCPLIYAYHSELGKVKHTLRFDDENRVDLEPTEMIDLKFALSTYGETAHFIFEINGYNPKNPTHT